MKKRTKKSKPFRCPWDDYKCQTWDRSQKDTGRRHFRIGNLSVAVGNPSRGVIPETSKGKNEWRVTLHNGHEYIKLSPLTDRGWRKREDAMKAAETAVRQLIRIAPAMISIRTTHGCEVTWPYSDNRPFIA